MYFRCWHFFFLLLFTLFPASRAAAQLPLPPVPVYAHYHATNSSLPTELIYKIHADRNGYLWLATDIGLLRYNGREFRLINTGQAEDFVSSCMADNDLLWLFSYAGNIAAIDLNTQKLLSVDSLYHLDRLRSRAQLFRMGIHHDSLLSLYDQSQRTVIRIRLDTRQSTSHTQNIEETTRELLNQYRFSPDWQQRLQTELHDILKHNYFGLSIKDSFITIGSRIFQTAPGKEARLFFDGAAYGITTPIMGFARRDNDLYLGGMQGIGFCRIRNYFSAPAGKQPIEQLLRESVTSVEKDYLDNIWVGTHGNGLFFFPYSEKDALHYNKSKSGLYSDRVSYIGRFAPDITILGYSNAVVDFYAGGKSQPVQYILPAGANVREVSHVEQMGFSWLAFTRNKAFFGGSANSTLPRGFHEAVLNEPSLDPGYKNGKQLDGVLYYISSNTQVTIDSTGSISRYHASWLKLPKRICLLPLSATDFYFGTVRGCYHNTRLLPYLRDAQVYAIDTVGGQLLWATNTGVYAIPLNAAEDSLQLKQLSALPCTALQRDQAFTYLRCADELIVIDNSNLRPVTRFSSRDYPQPFRLNSFFVDKHYLIMAGNLGVFYLPKQSLLSPAVPSLAKMHVLCSLNDYAPADSFYTCAYSKGMAALFELNVLDYKKDKREISCQILKDGEELYGERDLKEDGTVDLHPTGPGRYQIIYRVRSGYAGAIRTLIYVLVVTPLWYQQWWCMPLLIVAVALLSVWILYRVLGRQEKLQRQKLEQKIYLHELEAKSLLGQLKPHFIFNILTPLQGFFMRGEKLKGLDYLDHFSGLMRGMLQGIRHRYVALSTEITFINQYLEVQQNRFQQCFEYDIRVDPALDPDACFIPSLLLQPLVENAVEHGIVKNRAGGRIEIVFEALGDMLRIMISDNGRGLPPDWELKPDHALAIISERIQLLRKIKGTGFFQLVNNSEGREGTTAVLLLAKDNRI